MFKFASKKPKLGLALGSGGAKGMAHLGVLKALEEEGVAFDFIAGCSIGSVIGALYSKGYSADDMLNLLKESNLLNVQNILSFAFGMTSLEGVLSQFIGGAEFEDLIKPFKAVAVDVEKGTQVVLCEGDLSSALSASCAVPPLRPIMRNGKILVDGAFLNSVPADIVKEMGADFVLSVNLSKGSNTNQIIKSALDEIYPNNSVPLTDRMYQCYAYSNIVLEPNLSGFSSIAINELDAMYQVGYEECKGRINDIKNAISHVKKG